MANWQFLLYIGRNINYVIESISFIEELRPPKE